MLTAARMLEAFWYLFGALTRCVVFTFLDCCEWVAVKCFRRSGA